MEICHRQCFIKWLKMWRNTRILVALIVYAMVEMLWQAAIVTKFMRIVRNFGDYTPWINQSLIAVHFLFFVMFTVATVNLSLSGMVIFCVFKYVELMFYVCKLIALICPDRFFKQQGWSWEDVVSSAFSFITLAMVIVFTVLIHYGKKEIYCLDREAMNENHHEMMQRSRYFDVSTIPDRPPVYSYSGSSLSTIFEVSENESGSIQFQDITVTTV